jgi:predicted  nucleic acid-binding Zn-ribbon protein
MNLPSKLFELQKVADKLYFSQKRIFDIDQILSNNDEVKTATEALGQANLDLNQKEKHVQEKSYLEKELQNKIAFSESTLYGGMVKNPKELQDLQKELDSLKKRVKSMEEEHLNALRDFEESQVFVDSAESALMSISEQRANLSEALLSERETLLSQIKTYNQEYLVTSSNLPDDVKKIFETLFRTKKGKAVAVVEDNTCSICGITVRDSLIQQIKTSKQITYCSSCGRMLFTD